MNKLSAQKRNIEIECSITPHIPKYLKSDKVRFQQIINNLLGNAIKFSEEYKSIVIEFYFFAETNTLRVGIIDSGIGISEEDKKGIFKPFVTL